MGRIRASRGVADMNYKTFRLNDGVLYAMTSAIYVLKDVTYMKDLKDPAYYAIYFIAKTSEMHFYKDAVVVNRLVPSGFGNGQYTSDLLIFYYDCEGRKLYIWL